MPASRLWLILALAGLPACLHAGTDTVPYPELPRPSSTHVKEDKPTVEVSRATSMALKKAGWKVNREGDLVRLEGPDAGQVPSAYLEKASIKWEKGKLVYDGSPEAVDEAMLGPILKGLSSFASAARVERAKAGATLAAWGLPPSVDGRRLYDPSGDATYFGIMLHSLLALKPEQAANLGVERTSRVIDILDHAYGQAFYRQAPDIAQSDLDRARLILFASPRGGETPLGPPGLKARPDPAAMLEGYKAALQAETDAAVKAGDEVRRKDSAGALAVLNQLEKHRSHKGQALPVVPAPAEADEDDDEDEAEAEPYVPLASGLPGLLRVLDRIGGKPLTSEQQENLIRSFPMGDLVWSMGAQDLWKQGLTGKGVKIGVIDEGIARHPELDGAVKARANFTLQRGKGAVGSHGTHVAGIIHALAPDAELRGYAVLPSDEANEALAEDEDHHIIDAVRRAVADGNKIINMSLGGAAGPTDAVSRVVEEYASKGVIFLISAGNSRKSTGGIDAPSNAPSAITVGSLDSAGRMSDFSSFGERFDPRKLVMGVKDVFMAPGANIVSTVPSESKREAEYAAKSGTSMATPTLTGVAALLVQDMGRMTLVPSPIEAARRLKEALVLGSTPISLDKLPPNVPIDQPFWVVKPLKALEALRSLSVPVARK